MKIQMESTLFANKIYLEVNWNSNWIRWAPSYSRTYMNKLKKQMESTLFADRWAPSYVTINQMESTLFVEQVGSILL